MRRRGAILVFGGESDFGSGKVYDIRGLRLVKDVFVGEGRTEFLDRNIISFSVLQFFS